MSTTSSLYDILGIPRTATGSDIKKAYHKLALVHHPDKGGNPDRFKDIVQAYEILSDEEKRKRYDIGGMEAVQQQHSVGGGNGNRTGFPFQGIPFPFQGMPFPFPNMGNGMGRKGDEGGEKKSPDRHETISITLENIYTGGKKSISLKRRRVCEPCRGQGGSGLGPCHECQGKGCQVRVRQLGPGMFQQSSEMCVKCQGKGTIVSTLCSECHGEKTKTETKSLDVEWEPGYNQETIRIPFESDHLPDTLPGDVLVHLQVLPHPIFERKGPHLHMKKVLSLQECLCGWEGSVPFLDRSILWISSPKGETTPPQTTRKLSGKGITKDGHLYIHFGVEFPLFISEPDRVALLSTFFSSSSSSSSSSVVSSPSKESEFRMIAERVSNSEWETV